MYKRIQGSNETMKMNMGRRNSMYNIINGSSNSNNKYINNFHSALQTGFKTAKNTHTHSFFSFVFTFSRESCKCKNQLRNHTGVCVFGDDDDASLGDCIQTVSDQSEEQHFLSILQNSIKLQHSVAKNKKKRKFMKKKCLT